MFKLNRLLVLPLLFSALGARGAAPPRVDDAITVDLVNVDVHVVDRSGRPVAGLERSAFRLFDGDQPAEISHFSWIPGATASPARGRTDERAEETAPPRHVALFFDELQISNRSRVPVLRALDAQLVRGLRPEDRVSVVRFNGAEIEQLVPWTSDRKKIERGLEQLGSFSVRRLAAGQDLTTWMNLLQDDIKGGASKKHAGGCPDAGVILRGYADLVRRNAQSSASALLRYAQRLSHEPGPRMLVHVSDGIPLLAGAEAYQYAIDMCSGEALAQGVPGAFSVLADGNTDGDTRDRFDPFKARLEMNEYQMAPLWRDVAARVNMLGVTIYAVQASAPGAQFLPRDELGVVPQSVETLAQQNPVDTLSLLARETGGLLLRADRGADDEIGRLHADLGGYYSLAFTPTQAARPGARSIRVEIDRPDVRLRYRQSYHLSSRDERIAGRLVDLFDAERSENPLGFVLRFTDQVAATGGRVRIEIPLDRLTLIEAPEGGQSGRFVVYVTLREGDRILVPRRHEVPVAVSGEEAAYYTYDLDLPKGGSEIGVAIADEYSGEVSYARAELPRRAAPR